MTAPDGKVYTTDGSGLLHMQVGELHMLAKHTMTQAVEELGDAMDAIATAMDSLELNWAGEAKNEAVRLIERWQMSAESLFGTKKEPTKGVLIRAVNGVQNAAFAYNESEALVTKSWEDFRQVLETLLAGREPSAGDGGQDPEPKPITEV